MIAACYILHYGEEWLSWSMRSVRSLVDEIYVFYTYQPSHGHSTSLKNPESRDNLYDIARPYFPIWHDAVRYDHEGVHREAAVEACRSAGADLVVVVDADEIWDQEVLQNAISYAKSMPYRSFRIGMRHFWRSLKWVCDDPSMPTRLIRVDLSREFGGEEYFHDGKVFHMGYAQSPDIIYYKQSIHGHKNHWRDGWFGNAFMQWRPGDKDVHPTNENFWNPEPFVDDGGKLEYLISDHPYWNKDIIE